MRAKPVEFQIPDGFTLPEGTQPGEDFDAVCSFRVKPNGTVCLTMLGDVKMPGYDSKESSGKPRYDEYSRGMMEQMQPTQAE